jgi:hypothetical protein
MKEGNHGAAVRALELQGKHIGMWPNKIEANINLLERLSAKACELSARRKDFTEKSATIDLEGASL